MATKPRIELSAYRLSRTDYAFPSDQLAQRLLGCLLVRVLPDGSRLAGVIVETEAYLGVIDRAAHTFGGRRTARVEPMWGLPGTAYVYFTYGMHHCFNVSAGREGEPVAVLIRALQPAEGIEHMRASRSRGKAGAKPMRETDLCSGPGKLCQAMAIDRGLSGVDLAANNEIWLEPGELAGEIVNTARVGVGSAGDWAAKPLRWFAAGNPHVSRPRA